MESSTLTVNLTLFIKYNRQKCIRTLTNQYIQIDEGIQKSHILNIFYGVHFFKIPISHTQSMVLWCKLFSMAIHSMNYFCHVTRLYTDEWKLTFLCPNQLGH